MMPSACLPAHLRPAVCVQVTDEQLEAADVAVDDTAPARGHAGTCGLQRRVGRQSSAVNLNGLSRDAELKRLIDEVCWAAQCPQYQLD